MSTRKVGLLSPLKWNGSKGNKKHPGITSRQGKYRREFNGIRDRYGRATKAGKEIEPPKKNKQRVYPLPPQGYIFGAKPWLKRKEVWWEYNICPRSVRRLEIRGQLAPHVLMGQYLYDRGEIEAAIRGSKLLEHAILEKEGF